jgi:hypothetical protein
MSRRRRPGRGIDGVDFPAERIAPAILDVSRHLRDFWGISHCILPAEEVGCFGSRFQVLLVFGGDSECRME